MRLKTKVRAATAKVVAVDRTSPFQPCSARNRRTFHTESHREWHLLATDRGSVVYTIDDLKNNSDAQIMVGSILFFLLAFPLYFGMAANGADGSLGGGVADYQVNGEITYVMLDSGTEAIADGDTWSMTYNTDAINEADELNIVGVRISMSYGEDETSSGIGCAAPGSGNPAADTITGTASHLDFNGTADGQNNGGSGAHEAMAIWYNESMLGAVVSDLSMDEIKAQIDSMGAGLGDHSVSISVAADAGGSIGCAHDDGGETVDYTVELMVFDYTIAPYIDTSDI